MSIQLQDVKVLDNPASFTSNFRFRITFDCISPGVKEELEWKLVYVGSADNEDNDQELDQILVGPVRVGKNRFTFEAPAPNPSLIPSTDLLDVTVILLTCSYKEQEFIRIGYYVHNEYDEEINDTSDENIIIVPSKIKRNILADKPRVTRFNIEWDNNNTNTKEKCDEETKSKEEENNNQSEQEEEEEESDDEEEDDNDDNYEEDLADTEERDNNINENENNENESNNNSNNNTGAQEEDDDDIDMTE